VLGNAWRAALPSGKHAFQSHSPVAAPPRDQDRDRAYNQVKGLSLRFVSDEAQFRGLQEQWTTLHATQDVAFPERSFLWASTAWETIARPRGYKLQILTGYAAGELVLVLPLVLQHEWPIRIGRWLGPEIGEYSDVLVKRCDHSEQWTAGAWAAVASQFHLLRIPAIRADAKLWPHVERMRSPHRTFTSAPYIECSRWPDWQSYLKSRTSSFRADLKRASRKLRDLGEPRLIMIDRQDQLRAALDWIFENKISRFSHTHYAANVLATKLEFCRRICLVALESGRLHMSELWVGSHRIAAQWGIRSGSRLSAQMNAWDENWRDCGPGRLLDAESIRWAFEHAVGLYDLGIGKNEFKYRYTDKDLVVITDVVVAFPPLDRPLLFLVGAARSMRSFLRKMPRP
jgi:CelD/BcsL family acetyltransferase involved in cellulose biosynthesis